MLEKKTITNNYVTLNECLKEWYLRVSERGGLVVAISRKAPRLWEWCERNFSDMVETGNKTDVITEIALPFVNLTKYQTITVIDDAVYHGTTFMKVVDMVRDLKNPDAKLYLSPAVVTSDGKYISSDNDYDQDTLEMDDDYIPFYVDTIIQKFAAMGRPYDVEFPIMEVSLPKDGKKLKEVADTLVVTIAKMFNFHNALPFYDSVQYIRESKENDDKEAINYTILLHNLYDENLPEGAQCPDFAKLRLFEKNGRVNIVSYCVRPLWGAALGHNSLLLPNDFHNFWNRIYDECVKIGGQMSAIYEEDKSNIGYQSGKTLAVMMNYIYSYNQLKTLMPAIRQAFELDEKDEVNLSMRDVAYLVGEKRSNEFMEGISNLRFSPFTYKTPDLYNSSVPRSYFPKEYGTDYGLRTVQDYEKCKGNVSECLSFTFGNMHRMVELPSRSQPRGYYGRLRFGESYDSLVNDIGRLNKSDCLLVDIHKGMDSRIDRGSVVPNYVCINTAFGGYWARLFRSGENEDLLMEQTYRILLQAVKLFMAYNNGSVIIRSDELDCLVRILSISNTLKGEEIFRFHDSQKIVENVKKYGVLENYQGIKSLYVIADNRLARQINRGHLLSDETEANILKDSQLAVSMCKSLRKTNDGNDDISDIVAWIDFSVDDVKKDIKDWQKSLSKELAKFSEDKAINIDADNILRIRYHLPVTNKHIFLKALLSIDNRSQYELFLEQLIASVKDVDNEEILTLNFKMVFMMYCSLLLTLNNKGIDNSSISTLDSQTFNKLLSGCDDEVRKDCLWIANGETFANISKYSRTEVRQRLLNALKVLDR